MTKTTPTVPAIGQPWPEQGGTYIGIASDLPGGEVGHLVLLTKKPATKLNWMDAKAWAESLGDGARLPTRAECLLIFANAKQAVAKAWHWTSEEDDASYAWGCDFNLGSQDSTHKSYEGSAVAVRRLLLQSFNPLVPTQLEAVES